MNSAQVIYGYSPSSSFLGKENLDLMQTALKLDRNWSKLHLMYMWKMSFFAEVQRLIEF